MRAGELTFAVPLGEPPIDVETDGADRESKRVYLAPDELARQTTAPVPPTARVSVAPEALPDAVAPGETTFDSAATAPLPASRHAVTAPMQRAITTAAVRPTTTTVPVGTRTRSRALLAPLALLLALPAAVGAGWRWRARPGVVARGRCGRSDGRGCGVRCRVACAARGRDGDAFIDARAGAAEDAGGGAERFACDRSGHAAAARDDGPPQARGRRPSHQARRSSTARAPRRLPRARAPRRPPPSPRHRLPPRRRRE